MPSFTRKRIYQIVLITVSISSLFFVPWLLVKAWILPLPNTIQQQADQAVSLGFEGVIYYVDQVHVEPQFFTAGWHNKATQQPAQAQALYKIASISKLYDAVAITKLVAAKRLWLDKTVAWYLPELQNKLVNADQITLRMLVQHRSGLPNFTDTPNFWAAPTHSFEESMALVIGQPANFEPNTSYQYCNTNYLLLNKIMDQTLGYPNFQFIQKEILNPLHLTNTYGSLYDVDTALVMSGYHVGYPHDLKDEDHGMVATAQDVGIFVRALNTGSIFTPTEHQLYQTLYENLHDGWVPGYQSFARYDKDLDAVLIAFYNTTDADLLYWNLAQIINSRVYKILAQQQRN